MSTSLNGRPPRDSERDFIENLVSARFNWFMLLFGVILVYAYSVPGLSERCVILAYGANAALAIAVGTHRANVKLIHIIRRLHAIEGDPVKQSGEETRSNSYWSVQSAWLVGSLIPFGCSVCLVFLAVVSFYKLNWQLPTECYGAIMAFGALLVWYVGMRWCGKY